MADPATRASAHRYFPDGMDSFSAPDQLKDTEYAFGLNVANRGGLVQTRPGSKSGICWDATNAQGGCLFTPASGVAHQVIALDGLIWTSASPFAEWRQLTALRFNPASRFVEFESCLKSTDYDSEGILYFLDRPYEVLIIQDGSARAAYWDGSTAAHINPTPSAKDDVTSVGRDGTPIGLWMKWSNSRLYVNRGKQVFASDLGNPLKFKDANYVNEAPSFYLPAEGMGMLSLPENKGLLVAHERGVDFFATGILDRTLWLTTPNFQSTITEIPCVAPRSMHRVHGLVFYFSPAGLISLDAAAHEFISSSLIPLDYPMAWSKAFIGPDLTGVCSVAFENYLLVSVPFCSTRNTHTWAMDLAVGENATRSWNGVWVAWHPTVWFAGMVEGRARCFCLSRDEDGRPRVWENFLASRKDNECSITCSVQFRLDNLGTLNQKRFKFAEIECAQGYGDVSVMAAVAGQRGWFDRLMTKEIAATEGRVYGDSIYSTTTLLGGNRPQTRLLKTQEWVGDALTVGADGCNVCGVESDRLTNNKDFYFQLFVAWSGRMGIQGIRMFGVDDTEANKGVCEDNEADPRVLMAEGCAATEFFPDKEPFPDFVGTATATGVGVANQAKSIVTHGTATSQISQADADRKAMCRAVGDNSILAVDPDLFTIDTPDIVVTFPSEPALAIYSQDGLTFISFASTFDFGAVFTGSSTEVILRLVNTGDLPLTITSVFSGGSGYTVVSGPAQTTLGSLEYTFITISSAPT